MGLAIMIFGLAVFFGAHTFTTMRTQRAALIARTGEVAYKVAYSAGVARRDCADRLWLLRAIAPPA